MTEKQKIAEWNEFVKTILESTPIDEEESEEDRITRKALLEAHPEEWFRYYFPRFAYADPAPFHKEATRRILENKEWYEVRMWSRELAKSTRTMMEVFYLALVGHNATIPSAEGETEKDIKRCVLLVSNSLDNAERLLMPYKANLEYNKRIIQDYGDQYNHGSWEATEFVTQQGVAFRAIGAGQSPRGAKNGEVRPDILIFDDVDTDVDCRNPEIVAKKWHWIEEAAIGTRSISEPTTIIFCGNRIARDSCIERATRHADHVEMVNIRDNLGLSTWPQKKSQPDIDRVLGQKSYAAQQKEYFNNPVSEGSVFKQMAYKPARPLREYSTLVCYTDPSYKTTNDYKATVLVGKWQHEYHVIRCYLAQATTGEMIQWHLSIMDLVGDRACYYFMEQVFMQDVLIKEVCDAGRRIGRPIPIRGDTRKKPDKFQRIESLLEPLVNNGDLYLNESEKQNPHMVRLEEQFMAFAPGSHAHDDGPDAIEGAIWQIVHRENLQKPAPFKFYPRPNNDKRW
jgi:predicted phage terminase large subunit-like protein